MRVKNSNHLHTELSLGYLKDTEFYRESKAFFIHISGIASFKPFLIVWLWEYCTFRTVPWLALSPRLGQNTPSTELFSPKKSSSTIKLFSSSNKLLIRLLLANTCKKIGGYRRCFLTNCREMWSSIRRSLTRWRIDVVGTGTRHKMALMLCAEKIAQCKIRESP